MNQHEVLAGIRALGGMQDAIRGAIRNAGGRLRQDAFDEWYRTTRGERGHFNFYTPETFVLGGMHGPHSREAYIELAQLMCQAGLLTTETERGKVVYLEAIEQ